MSLQVHSLYRGRTVSIFDVCCRPECREHGPEEYSSGHHIVFPRSGVFLKRVAGREFVADPNHVLFFNQAEPYRVAHPVAGGDDCTVFEFRQALLLEVITSYRPRVEERPELPFEFTYTLSNNRAFLFQHRVRQRLLSGFADALTVDEISLELLAAVMRQTYVRCGSRPARRRATTLRAHREQAQRTRLLLCEHFTESLDLADIARAVHSSAFHLSRVFREQTGLAIYQYRNRLRLRAAMERLVQQETDLAALALDLGFASHSHFSDAFRRAFGVAPSECRRRASSSWLREMSKNLEAGEIARA
jgi:AraC family transcriptional regulator